MLQPMQPESGLSRKLRRFNRKYGTMIFLIFIVGAVIALVVLLMWMLADPRFRSGV